MGIFKNVVKAGAGLAALAALGAYWLSPKGRQDRVKIRGWVLKFKGDVLDRLENLNHVNKASYDQVLWQVTKRYRRMKNVNKRELAALVGELKGSWKILNKELSRTLRQNGRPRTR